VVFPGLSRFKNINRSLDHDAGDEVPQEVSARPATVVRKGETAARLFGEEFAFGYQFYTASTPRLSVRSYALFTVYALCIRQPATVCCAPTPNRRAPAH